MRTGFDPNPFRRGIHKGFQLVPRIGLNVIDEHIARLQGWSLVVYNFYNEKYESSDTVIFSPNACDLVSSLGLSFGLGLRLSVRAICRSEW